MIGNGIDILFNFYSKRMHLLLIEW